MKFETATVPLLALLLVTGCIGEGSGEDSGPPPVEDPWMGEVRVHLVLPTMQGGPDGQDPVLQPIDRTQLRGLVDVPTFVHHDTPELLDGALEDCAVDSEARDPQLPPGTLGSFSDVVILGDCGPQLGELLLAQNLETLFASRLTEVLYFGEPGQIGRFPADFERRVSAWRSTPPRVEDCYPDTKIPDLCLGCELHETSQGFTGPFGEPIEGAKANRCIGEPGSTGGFGAYNLYRPVEDELIGNLWYRSADHEVDDRLVDEGSQPPTLSQPDADNWRWERGSEWPEEAFRMVPNIDGYILPLDGDPPEGTTPVGWQAARHATFDAEVDWPIADRVYVTFRDEGSPEEVPVVAITIELDDADPTVITDVRWFARRGEATGGLLPAEERLFRNESNFFIEDADPEWLMARTPVLPPLRP